MSSSVRKAHTTLTPDRDDLIPLAIAVTGHRSFPSEIRPLLEQAITDLIRTLRRQYPSTPLWFYSGLAEGADRLAAKVAAAHATQLVAVLPMSPAVYEQDFPTEESCQEFRQLLSEAVEIVVTEEVDSAGTGNMDRGERYARQGVFLVQNCDILLALWDGDTGDGIGGTADVVKFRLEGVPQIYDRSRNLFEKRTGPVYHIFTPRLGTRSMQPAPGTVRLLLPPNVAQRPRDLFDANPSFAAIDGFNCDLQKLADSGNQENVALGDDPFLAEVPAERQAPLRRLRHRFHQADQLAILFQARTWRVFQMMLLCSLLSMVCLQMHTSVHGASGQFLALYVLLLLGAYALYGWSKHNRYESRAFDYRAIAEGLRIQAFWRLAGLSESVADHYLGRQQGVLRWIRRALMTWTSAAPNPLADKSDSVASLQLVLNLWIGDQLRYFAATAEKQQSLRVWLGRLANGFLFLGVVLAALKTSTGSSHWLYSFAAVPPLIAATLLVYANTRALSEQVNQYESMRELFQAAEEQLRARLAAKDIAGGRQLLLELGKEALAENADWLTLHRRRPMNSPAVGS